MRGRALLLLVAGGLVLAGLAWWLLRPSSSGRLRPLDPASQRGEGDGTTSVRQEASAGERFPGRRKLTGPAAPAGVKGSELGSEQIVGDGHRLRILEHEETLRAPVEGQQGDLVVDTARVEACAGGSEWSGGALAAAFHLAYPRPTGGFDLRPASSGLAVREPVLSDGLTGVTLAAGECRKGWVAFALGTPGDFDDRLPTSIVFDNTAFGFVPPGARGRVSWEIGR